VIICHRSGRGLAEVPTAAVHCTLAPARPRERAFAIASKRGETVRRQVAVAPPSRRLLAKKATTEKEAF
jgi:hypothetical protein